MLRRSFSLTALGNEQFWRAGEDFHVKANGLDRAGHPLDGSCRLSGIGGRGIRRAGRARLDQGKGQVDVQPGGRGHGYWVGESVPAFSLVVTRRVPFSFQVAAAHPVDDITRHLDGHVDEAVVDDGALAGEVGPHLLAEVGPIADAVGIRTCGGGAGGRGLVWG